MIGSDFVPSSTPSGIPGLSTESCLHSYVYIHKSCSLSMSVIDQQFQSLIHCNFLRTCQIYKNLFKSSLFSVLIFKISFIKILQVYCEQMNDMSTHTEQWQLLAIQCSSLASSCSVYQLFCVASSPIHQQTEEDELLAYLLSEITLLISSPASICPNICTRGTEVHECRPCPHINICTKLLKILAGMECSDV